MYFAMKNLISDCIYPDSKLYHVGSGKRIQFSSDFFDAVV